jgi:hypothetical protein
LESEDLTGRKGGAFGDSYNFLFLSKFVELNPYFDDLADIFDPDGSM